MDAPLWSPGDRRAADSNLSHFMAEVGSRTGNPFRTYDDLYKFSVADRARFWAELWEFADVKGSMGEPPFLADSDLMPGARFFPNAQLNFAENALARRPGRTTALVFWGEENVRRRITWHELRGAVAKAQAMLRAAGVTVGDCVAAMLPNIPEAVICALATASIGAVWSSCSPDFGVQGVLDRFGQIEPKLLIGCDGYCYNGKTIDTSEKIAAIAARLPTVEHIIVVSYLGRDSETVKALKTTLNGQSPRIERWDDAVTARSAKKPKFMRLPFDHPLYVLFSSGTTGAPKCIVHSAGGVLLKHLCEHQLHSDIRPGDRLFYFTTLGWMMWNWLVSSLASGATLLLYDGSPFFPSGHVLWDYAAAERCTHFGTSAKYIDSLKKAGFAPGRSHNLPGLRSILSTGSPLAPESFDYVYSAVKRDVHLTSISGGTDICGCFVLGNPLKPVWRGEIQGPALGLAVDIFNQSGQSVRGEKGDLVCRNAFPSMPIGLWNDADGRKYRSTYFERFPGVWHHGDFAEWTEHDGMVIHGRSDATLNPGGVRIGTAEIYRQVESILEVYETVVVGQDFEGDVRIILFVVLKPGVTLDDELRARIKKQIRQGASPRHVPAKIIAVADIPRTKSGKITEIAVRDAIMGREIKNTEALANPEALRLFQGIEELRT